MSGFGTDAQVMEQAAGQIEDVRNNVDAAIQQLDSQIAPLAGVWKGAASTAFMKLMDAFRQNADTITTKLQEISENVKASGQDYAQREEETAQEVSKIEGLLNG